MIGSDFLINNLFLGDVKLAVTALIITNTWQYAGYIMMIYFAALQNVPSSLVESASLDGANVWQRPRHINIPMVMPAFTVSLFLDNYKLIQDFRCELYIRWWTFTNMA